MGKDCKCEYFEEKGISPNEIFKNFIPLGSSESQKSKYSSEGEFTSLLKCHECYSYYLINFSNSCNNGNEVVPIIRYYPKVGENILIKTIKSLEGIINKKELDECCDLSLTVINLLNKDKNNRK